MKKITLFSFLIVSVAIVYRLVTQPSSPGNFYDPPHYFNLFLPNFGIGSDISILPDAFKTLMTDYSFLKVLLELFQEDVVTLHRFLYVLSPLMTFFAFILFFCAIPTFRKKMVLASALLALTVDWAWIATLIGMTVLFCVIKLVSKKNVSIILLILPFVTLSLYWHSAHILFLSIYLSALLFSIYHQNKTHQLRIFMTFLTMATLSILVWVLLQENPIFSQLFKLTYFLDPSIIYNALFSQGSFIPLDYQYIYDFYMPVFYMNLVRYAAYLMVFFVILLYVLRNILAKKYDQILFLITSLFVGSSVFIFLYYIATETIGPAPLLIFLIPFLLMLCFSSTKPRSTRSKINWGILFILLMSSQLITAFHTQYTNETTSTAFSVDFKRYSSPSSWLTKYLYNGNILSDANTLGYLAIWYGINNAYTHFNMHFLSIGLATYDQIYRGNYQGDSLVIYNFDIYKKNLMFESLQAWNKFKPLPPEIIQLNYFNVLYNDAGILILNKC